MRTVALSGFIFAPFLVVYSPLHVHVADNVAGLELVLLALIPDVHGAVVADYPVFVVGSKPRSV